MLSTSRVAIALGSNRGDRVAHLTFAAERLRELLGDFRLSTFHETEPVGIAAQPRFLNAAVTGTTSLSAGELLQQLLLSKRRADASVRYEGAPRTLDLDLIVYGDDGSTSRGCECLTRGFAIACSYWNPWPKLRRIGAIP